MCRKNLHVFIRTLNRPLTALAVGPPVPPPSVQVSERSSKVTSSSILFRFNCSWFSDMNGAVRFFSVIVAESDGRSQETLFKPADEQCLLTSLSPQPRRRCSQNSATLCPPTRTTPPTPLSEPIRPPTSPAAARRTRTPPLDRCSNCSTCLLAIQ